MPDLDPLVDRLAAYLCDEDRVCPDCVTAAGRALRFLANANLPLPDGGETRTEWGPRCSDPSHLGQLFVHEEMVSAHAVDGYRARREAREWPDGSSWTGPWVEVTDA
jgi:hypothetical protein